MTQENAKLEAFCRLCSDLDYREKLFSSEASQTLLQRLELRDFPLKQLMSCPAFDLKKSLLGYEYSFAKVNGRRDKRSIKVTADTQQTFLTSLLAAKESSNSLFIITGITDFQKARFTTFLLTFLRLMPKGSKGRPYWYTVRGGFEDILRDSEDLRNQRGVTDFLVLDGISLNSSKLKVEKINDLLNLFQNSRTCTDVVILAAGFDPLKIAAEQLNTTFQVGLYFDEGLITSI